MDTPAGTRDGAVPDDGLHDRVRAWLDQECEPWARDELAGLLGAHDDEALAECFDSPLEFGTAGLRGALGAGPGRMNLSVVRRVTWALARWLGDGDAAADAPVVVGYDARKRSAEFAREAAGVLAAAGRPVRLADRPWPTPVTAFAVRHLGACAGVMVTASHNPAGENGYKVFQGDGSQICAPVDTEVLAIERSCAGASSVPCTPESPLVGTIGRDVLDAYLDEVGALAAPSPRGPRAAYTPLHGVGGATVRDAWRRAGLAPLVEVASQREPDGGFPTTPVPNPELVGVLDEALVAAEEAGATLVLANDPDADRLAVCVRRDGWWHQLSGDEVGALLCEHLLARRGGAGGLVVSTVASSTLVERIAARHGATSRRCLTGFKWIAEATRSAGDLELVLGYEEALGYAVGPHARDKDGVSAALVLYELAGTLAAAGRDLLDARDALWRLYGVHLGEQLTVPFAGTDARAAMAAAVAAVRESQVREVGGRAVLAVVDLATGVRRARHGAVEAVALPRDDVLVFELSGGSRVVLRPSGTEPKLKCYLQAVAQVGEGDDALERARRRCEDELDALRSGAWGLLGVTPPTVP